MKFLFLILIFLNISISKPIMDEKITLDGKWLFKTDPKQIGNKKGYFKDNFEKKDWVYIDVPQYWEDHQNFLNYDGWGWYVKTFFIEDADRDLIIYFTGIDDDAKIWINGKEIGNHSGYNQPSFFNLKGVLKNGLNTIVVKVIDYGGPGGIYKPVFITEARNLEKYLKSPLSEQKAIESADWVKNAIIYSVYLRSFSKEGTFKALENKISELKNLGVNVIWLLPIHPVGKLKRKGKLGSPYSVQDYYSVNPEFGTLEDFKSLVKTIHHNELKIIIDLVANHTSWDSKIIKNHPEWFTKDVNGKIISPNSDWIDVADLDYSNNELRNYMIEMMKWWVREIDIDGFRCDVAELVPLDFWETARAELNKIKPILMLSEGSLPEHHLNAFDITYSWNVYDALEPLLKGKLKASSFHQIFKNELLHFPASSLRLRFNTNHDKNAWDKPAIKKFGLSGLKLSAVLINTIPGVPLLYNGEEVANDRRLDLFEKVEIDWSRKSEMYDLYKTLFTLRKQHPALINGIYEPVEVINEPSVVAFIRKSETEQILVILNFNNRNTKIELKLANNFDSLTNLMTNEQEKINLTEGGNFKLSIKPHEYFIYLLK